MISWNLSNYLLEQKIILQLLHFHNNYCRKKITLKEVLLPSYGITCYPQHSDIIMQANNIRILLIGMNSCMKENKEKKYFLKDLLKQLKAL